MRSFAPARLWLSSQRLEECRASALSPITARAGMAAGRAPGLLCTFATATLRFLAAALEPVEHLRGRVDLVVVLPLGKHRQLVHTLKSLSSEALLAVSQLCTIRSNSAGHSFAA